VCLQACLDPGGGLSVLTAEHPPAVPSAHCPGVGGAVSGDRRDTTRVSGASLYRGRAVRTRHHLLAARRAAGPPALGCPGGGAAPDHGSRSAADATGYPRARPARAAPADHPWASVGL